MSVKAITKGYFFGAMAVSAIHTVHSFEKLGLDTGEQWLTPLAVDGLAFLGLSLRSRKYADSTNKIGLRLQVGAGILQLAANLYAASSVGGMVLGALVVGIYLLAEAISPRIKTRAEAEAEEAEARAVAEREAKNARERARRAERKTEAKALENLVSRPSRSRRSRTLQTA